MTDIPLLPDVEPNILFTNAWFNPDTHQPAVYWQLNGKNGLISLIEAKARAQGLFQAIGYAEGEGAIVKGMIYLHTAAQSKPKGFKPGGKTVQSDAEKQGLIMAAQLREFLKQGRSPLPEGIEMIFGYKTRKALINVHWYGELSQWETLEALEHAVLLIQTAEAAESDAFFRWFLMEKLNIGVEETYSLIVELQDFRNRRQLEDLFKEGMG